MSSRSALDAVDGEVALRTFADHRNAVHLQLTDVIMPKKNGRDIAGEIKKLKPSVKVLFMSGCTADIIRARSMLDAEVFFLSKPIIPDQLLVNVRQVLNA